MVDFKITYLRNKTIYTWRTTYKIFAKGKCKFFQQPFLTSEADIYNEVKPWAACKLF